ncbi:hypothetical protein A1O1_06722 [Capronia coronata CBS 617.96]|uniref:Uncharacterized protein n=1 Tax=Capronia coronata CBS 617.96 TaxID=1182541 RepID=W9YLF3_9EURO|nr:uncharacterized protein A1O1_06722 [Capronia coronata CBS 617.96]EXJ83104.1 hypothetical protein A1O1_06722 [Capronia coronata CBS 617.96]
MDPESSDSDVSVGGGDEYRFASPLTAPIPLPPPPSKHALESSDAVQGRLDELQRVEEHNIKKYELLKSKRARKDDKIRRKRELQDKKWAAILEARQRRDGRIEARRKREDAAFSQFFDQELEEEENSLRRRLKRLKRGLPPEESPKPGAANISSTSMSPLASTLSTLPPPPKRHQVGPPGQADSANPAQSRPSPQSNLAAPSKTSFSASPYSFFRDSSSAYPRPFHHTSPYSTTPNTTSSTTHTNALANPSQPSTERSHLSHLGRPGSPLSRPGLTASFRSPATPVTPATPANAPRQTSSNYDTRPPPTTSTAFAPINTLSTSGFATINPRTTSTSPLPNVGLPRPSTTTDVNKTPSHQILSGGVDSTRFHSYAAPSSVSTPSTGGPNKRTPSTTHPYQMSEAFANRHHHCERVDSLNRGIWTSYGVGGSKDNPTGPPVEMYLRCNHDGCSRIDWRTVHGLQCHIVKNHVQPKGTIGSLDKALEKYGVPVKEVEDYERIHGRGSAGTMADPKNHKIKIKTQEASGSPGYTGDRAPGSYVIDPETRPAGYRPSSTSTVSSPPATEEVRKSPKTATQIGSQKDGTAADAVARKAEAPLAQTAPTPSFSAASWLSSYMSPRKMDFEPKKLQGDFGMGETQGKDEPATARAVAGALNGQPQAAQPPVSKTEPPRAGFLGISTMETPNKAATNGSKPPSRTASPPAAAAVTSFSTEPVAEAVETEPGHEKSEAADNTTIPMQEDAQPSQSKDEDVHMTGTGEDNGESEKGDKVNHATTSEKNEDPKSEEKTGLEGAAQGEDSSDHSETIVVDGDAGEDTGMKKKPPQSPSMTAKTLSAITPTSAKRPSRRSSAARRSVEIEGDGGYTKDGKLATNVEEDKDDKEAKEDKDVAKPEPRRSLNGRILRRGRV